MPKYFSRRAFLRKSIATGVAGVGVLSHLDAQEKSAATSTRRIKVGFLGVEHSHAESKIKILRESSDFELIGFSEEDERIRNRVASSGIRALNSDELLSQAEVIVVESAVKDLARHARQALEAGKHVHLEKPGAGTLKEFQELTALAKEKSRVLQVGYMWRYNPGLNKAIEAARNGWLGQIYMVRATMNTMLDGPRRPEWAEFRGGALFEQGCHLIDALVRLMGEPSKITSFLKTSGPYQDNLADNTAAVFEFNRALGIITDATLQPNAFAHRFFEIMGTNGTAILKPIEPPNLQLDLGKAAGPYKAGSQSVELPQYRRYVAEFVELAHAIRENKPLSVSLDQELAIHKTLLQACQMAAL